MKLELAALMKKRKMTGYQLAKATGLSANMIYTLLNRADGDFKRIEVRTINALCRALNCTPGDLLTYTPDKQKGAA